MPFDEDLEDISKLKMVGKNERSMFKQEPSSTSLEEKVKEIEKNKQKYRQEIAKLSLQLKKVLDDKTLQENKNVLSKSIESDTVKEIIDLAQKINSDQNEQEGMGSLLLCTILLKALLSSRDRQNKIEYDLSVLKDEFKKFPDMIEKRLERLTKKE